MRFLCFDECVTRARRSPRWLRPRFRPCAVPVFSVSTYLLLLCVVVFDAPRAVIRQLMQRTVNALKSRKHALLESPTGTGKSAASISAALAWQVRYRTKYGRGGHTGAEAPAGWFLSWIRGVRYSGRALDPSLFERCQARRAKRSSNDTARSLAPTFFLSGSLPL